MSILNKWSSIYEEDDDEINENLNNNSEEVVTLFDLPLTIQNCAKKIKTLNRIPIVVVLSNRTVRVRVMIVHKHFLDVATHLMGRPTDDQEPLNRKDLLSLTKLEAEGRQRE